MNEDFWSPRLVGKRFSDHTVPLEILKDFSALEEMLLEAAKWHYKMDNPDCQRVPRGFGHDVSLHLSGIEEGSSIVAIALSFSTSLFSPASSLYFEKAKESIIQSVAAIDSHQQPPLPKNILSYFDKFGRGLQENEFMELATADNSGSVVRLNRLNRKKLVEASNSDIVTETLFLRGRVYSVDLEIKNFGLELNSGAKLKAVLDSQHQDDVISALTDGINGLKVFIQADVATQITTKKQSIVSVDSISPLESLDIGKRIDDLLQLKKGWLDGRGVSLSPEGCQQITDGFDFLFNKNLPLPFLFPTPEGGLSLEWDVEDRSMVMEVDLFTLDATYQLLFYGDDDLDREGTISLKHDRQESYGWDQLNLLITYLSQGV